MLIEGAIGSGHPQFGPFVAQSASSSKYCVHEDHTVFTFALSQVKSQALPL